MAEGKLKAGVERAATLANKGGACDNVVAFGEHVNPLCDFNNKVLPSLSLSTRKRYFYQCSCHRHSYGR